MGDFAFRFQPTDPPGPALGQFVVVSETAPPDGFDPFRAAGGFDSARVLRSLNSL